MAVLDGVMAVALLIFPVVGNTFLTIKYVGMVLDQTVLSLKILEELAVKG
jgi:hypothetical protein